MLRANRYALAAALSGAPLEPSVQALHGGDNPVYVRVSAPGEVCGISGRRDVAGLDRGRLAGT